MIVITIKEGIITCWLFCNGTFICIITSILNSGVIVYFPICVAPFIINSIFPCVERSGHRRRFSVPNITIISRTNFTEHKEIFSVFGTGFHECIIEYFVKCKSANMSYGIYTESINTHINIVCISIY